MSQPIQKIAHATDLLPEGGVAFVHSVALARDLGAELFSLHANIIEKAQGGRTMPEASALLNTWNDAGDKQSAIVHHKITHDCCDDPVDTLLDALRDLEPDLLVVASHQRRGIDRVMKGSVAESLAANCHVPTLLLPIGKNGFIQEWSGRNHLQRILIPVYGVDDAAVAIDRTLGLVEGMHREDVDIYLLHVGGSDVLDNVNTPSMEGVTWHRLRHDGEVMDEIDAVCERFDIDLITMVTRGQESLLDVVKGTQTQRAMRRTVCPLLVIPAR